MFFIRQLIRSCPFSKSRLPIPTSIVTRSFKNIVLEDIPDVSATTIRKVLQNQNICFNDGYTSFIIRCPICRTNSKSNLYINKRTGLFLCMDCKTNGDWKIIENYLKERNKKGSKPIILEVLKEKDIIKSYIEKIQSDTIEIKDLSNQELQNTFSRFKLSPISSKVLDLVKIRIDSKGHNLYFPLTNTESETVGYKVLNLISESSRIEPSQTCTGVLFGRLKLKESAVIVPNINDFLLLLDAKISLNVVCLPNGLANLSQYVLPSLERFNKLILWFGTDIQSWDCARNFAKKLGESRCLLIRPLDKHQLPHLAPNEDFKSIIHSAQPILHKSITNFAALREDVFSDLQNIDKVQGVKWQRYPTLNKILKGHRKGELTVITGPTGSGKTTFISEYSLDLASQGVNTLWGSFEIRNARLARTMLQQYVGMPLDEHLSEFDVWADKFEQLPLYFMTFHGQQSVKVVMEAVDHAAYVHDITHVIIDNLQFMMGTSENARSNDRFLMQDVIVAAFRNFATKKNCHVTLVIHPRKEKDSEDLTTSSIFGGAKASQEADNVLIIQDKRLSSVRGKKFLQVAKNRYSGDLGIMPLDFDKLGLSYAQKKKKEPEKTSNQDLDTNPSANEPP